MKLHLGCGNKFIPGFVHIDVLSFPHVDHISQIDSLTFIEDDSIDLIYNCHVLEHFKRQDVGRVLKEWFRVLRPGGILRTAVPDFEKLSMVYSETKNLDLILGPLFGGCNYLYNIHYNTFDFLKLKEVLESAGFSNVERYDWRNTEHVSVDDFSQAYIPHMGKDNGILISLNVECIKEIK